MQSGKFHITEDFIGHVFRTSTAGASDRNSYVLDLVHAIIGYVSDESFACYLSSGSVC